MNTIFDKENRDGLITRIQALTQHNTAQWGQMNEYQMLKHCSLWDEMILRNKRYERAFMGMLFGKVLLRKETKDDTPMRKNNPTIAELKITETDGDIESQKLKWIALINEYAAYSLPDFSFVHPFFGKMTKEQIGYHAYKHTDHHLRQFNASGKSKTGEVR
jgi:Protein of unknown function (DUF1569)